MAILRRRRRFRTAVHAAQWLSESVPRPAIAVPALSAPMIAPVIPKNAAPVWIRRFVPSIRWLAAAVIIATWAVIARR